MKRTLVMIMSMIFALVGTVMIAVGCGPEEVQRESGPEVGVYYMDTSSGEEWRITLSEGCTFTFEFGTRSFSGTYVLEDTSLSFSSSEFSDLAIEKPAADMISATLQDDAITVTWESNTVYRFLKKIEYTVSFSTDGGTAIPDVKVINGKTVAEPSKPEKAGNVFVGWYTDSSFTSKYLFSQPVRGDLRLYARFVEPIDPEFIVSFDLNYPSAPAAPEQVTTTGGKVFMLPEDPTRPGYEFAGWWVSHFDSAEKLTYRYEEQELFENTTLFAVWKDAENTPLVSVGEKGVKWTVEGVNHSFRVKISKDGLTVSERSVNVSSFDYDFSEQEPGEYVVEVTDSTTGRTATAYYHNKMLPRVSVFSVEGDVLLWNAVKGAEKYLVTVACGNATHTHVTEPEEVTENHFDFSDCDMVAGGIRFTVVASADGYDLSEPAEYVFERTLETVKGLQVDPATQVLSWEAVQNATSYSVTVKRGTETVFEENLGNVLEFPLKTYAKGTYSLSVVALSRSYNSSAPAEISYDKPTIATPVNLRLVGYTVEWDQVDGADHYELSLGDGSAPITCNENSYELSESSAASYSITVKAIAANASESSLPSDVFQVKSGEMTEPVYHAGVVTWDSVFGVTTYYVRINEGEEHEVTGGNRYEVTFTQKGRNEISVCALTNEGERTDWVTITVDVYAIEFDVGTGHDTTEVPTIYKATGDPINVEEYLPTRLGYEFNGWYESLDGGQKYEDKFFNESSDFTLYALWAPRAIKVYLYSHDDNDTPVEATVYYEQSYNLTPPETDDVTMAFYGWSLAPHGTSNYLYTDEHGDSLRVWNELEERNLYGAWTEIFTFTPIAEGKEYSVSKASGIRYVSEVTIPETYQDLPVTTVDNFAQTETLEIIHIPNTVKLISLASTVAAFRSCKNLRAVEVYEVEGNHDVYYHSHEGVLYYDNNITGNMELVYFPQGKTGVYTIWEEADSIPDRAFLYAYNIEEIKIPANVVLIGTQAFQPSTSSNSNLKTITFLEATGTRTELEIRPRAFASLSKLQTIVLPSNMKEIPADAFASCSSLSRIEVVGDDGMYAAKLGFLCKKLDDNLGIEITYSPGGYTGKVDINDPTVITIGESAFSGNENITELVIPEWMTEIKANAFNGCSGLLTITFKGDENSTDLTIREKAFYGCTGLTEVDLPANLVTLETGAFGNSDSVAIIRVNCGGGGRADRLNFAEGAFSTTKSSAQKTLYLGKDVPTMNVSGVFGGLGLVGVVVDPSNTNYSSDDLHILYDAKQTTIVYYPLTRQGSYDVPETVTTIGAEVFRGRTGLTSITIPAGVTSIGNAAFYGCSSLTSITFKEGAGEGAELTIGDEAFRSTKLVNVTLPKRTVSLGKSAFYSVSTLTSITLNEGLKEIGSEAFRSCSALTTIELPSTLTSIGDSQGEVIDVFNFANALAHITVKDDNKNYKAIDDVLYMLDEAGEPIALMFVPKKSVGKAGVVDIPDTVESIWGYAFRQNEGVQKVTFSKGVKGTLRINENAFYYCENSLAEIELPKGLQTIGQYAFYNCSALTTINIPNTVESIQASAFYNCTSLSKLTFEEADAGDDNYKSLEIVGKTSSGVFYGCEKLTNVYLPDRLTKLGDYAFYNCPGIRSVSLPYSLTEIGASVFYQAPIETIEFRKDADGNNFLETIGRDAFNGSKITSIELPNHLKTISQGAFDGSDLGGELVIPATVTSIGMGAFEEAKIEKLTFAEGSQITELENSPFMSCYNLTKIDLRGCTQLVDLTRQVFKWCYNLEEVNFPASLETLGETNNNNGGRVFTDDFKLTTVTFEAGSHLRYIQRDAFEGTALKKFVFPESTNDITIGDYIFRSCYQLEEIYISSSVKSLGNALAYCGSVKKITLAENHPTLTFDEKSGLLTEKASGTVCYYISSYKADETLTLPAGTSAIAPAAFAGQTQLKEIVIPDTVKTIGDYAFMNCVNLETVTFLGRSQLVSIGQYVFRGAYKIQRIDFPEGFETVSKYAFSNAGIGTVTFPSTLETFAEYAFQYSTVKHIEFATKDSTLTTIGNYAFDKATQLEDIVLPESLTSLGIYVFRNCSSLSRVNTETAGLADLTPFGGLSQLENYTFTGCSSLQKVLIPSNITKLGTNLFQNCTGLKEADLRECKATALGAYTFDGCSELQKVTLPAGVNYLGTYSFRNCTSLSMINSTTEGVVDLTGTALTVLGTSATAAAVSGGAYTFQNCSSIKEVKLPDNLTKIAAYVFDGCSQLKTINLDKVTILGNYTFRGCGFEQVTIPKLTASNTGTYLFAANESLTRVDLSNLAKITNYMFQGCTSLASVEIPASVTALGTNSFQDCTGLKKVDFAQGFKVTSLGGSFLRNTGLESFTFPDSVTTTGTYVLAECENLQSVTLNKVKTISNYAFQNSGKLATVDLGEATSIGTNAFQNTALVSITIPASVTTIGNYAFAACSSLNTIMLGAGSSFKVDENNCLYNADDTLICAPAGVEFENETLTLNGTSIAVGALYGCKNIKTVVIGEGITSIPNYAFWGTGIKNLVVPETVTSIGDYAFAASDLETVEFKCAASAFYTVNERTGAITWINSLFRDCASLRSVTFPEGLDTIGNYWFSGCVSLESIKLPESVTTINTYAFADSGLTSFDFTHITTIQTYAFTNTKLVSVTIPATVTTLNSYAFYEISTLQKVDLQAPISANYLFANDPQLTTVTLPQGFTEIADHMFENDTLLEKLEFPQGLSKIGSYAFANSGIKNVVIPDTVYYSDDSSFGGGLGSYAFAESALETIVVGKNILKLPQNIFLNCDRLTSVKLPENLIQMEHDAFSGCTALMKLVIPKLMLDDSIQNESTANRLFYGWGPEQTIYFEASERLVYSSLYGGWDLGCNAKFVFDYVETNAQA